MISSLLYSRSALSNITSISEGYADPLFEGRICNEDSQLTPIAPLRTRRLYPVGRIRYDNPNQHQSLSRPQHLRTRRHPRIRTRLQKERHPSGSAAVIPPHPVPFPFTNISLIHPLTNPPFPQLGTQSPHHLRHPRFTKRSCIPPRNQQPVPPGSTRPLPAHLRGASHEDVGHAAWGQRRSFAGTDREGE